MFSFKIHIKKGMKIIEKKLYSKQIYIFFLIVNRKILMKKENGFLNICNYFTLCIYIYMFLSERKR